METKNQLLIHQPRPTDREQANVRRLFHELYAFTRPSALQENSKSGHIEHASLESTKDDDGFRSRMEARCRRYRIGRHLSPDGFTASIDLGPGAQDLLLDEQNTLEHLGTRTSLANITELRNGLFGPKGQGRLRYKFWWKSKGSSSDQIQVTYQHNRPESGQPALPRSQCQTAKSQSTPHLAERQQPGRATPRSASPWNIVKEARSAAVVQHRSLLESPFQQYIRSGRRCFANFYNANKSGLDSLEDDSEDNQGTKRNAGFAPLRDLFISQIPMADFPMFGSDQINSLSWICSRPITMDLLAMLLGLVRWKILSESAGLAQEPNATCTRVVSRWIALKNMLPFDRYRSSFVLPLLVDALTCAVACLTEYQHPNRFNNAIQRQRMYKAIRMLVQTILGPPIQNLSDCPFTLLPKTC